MTTATPTAAVGRGWRDRGACRYLPDPDVMFPLGVDDNPPRRPGDAQQAAIDKAKTVCGRCHVTADCLAAAIARDERWGIWGGLTTTERDALTDRTAITFDLPAGVDPVRLARLVDGQRQPGRSPAELAAAAVRLHDLGHGAGIIAQRLHINATRAKAIVDAQTAGNVVAA